jgi:hypothetical protein
MAGKKAVGLSPEIAQRLAQIERMTNAQVRKAVFNCMDDSRAGKITNREADAIVKAARRRLSAFRRALRDELPGKVRERATRHVHASWPVRFS